jgi:hypothetical protein
MSLRQKFISMPRQPTAELIAREQPQPQPDITTTAAWLQRQFEPLHRALGQLLADEREKIRDQLERKTAEFEIKLAKLTGAIDVLRGAQPPPPAKFPNVKTWSENAIHYEGEVVTFDGSTYQAQRDTARAPPSPEWTCLAAAGAGFTVRGTYNCNETYKHFDVVVINGSSFVALQNNPGPCPATTGIFWLHAVHAASAEQKAHAALWACAASVAQRHRPFKVGCWTARVTLPRRS